jgi:hypothetical protein
MCRDEVPEDVDAVDVDDGGFEHVDEAEQVELIEVADSSGFRLGIGADHYIFQETEGRLSQCQNKLV